MNLRRNPQGAALAIVAGSWKTSAPPRMEFVKIDLSEAQISPGNGAIFDSALGPPDAPFPFQVSN